MSRKYGKCLKVQAKEIFQNITCLGRSKHDDKVQAAHSYDLMQHKPDMTKQEYINSQIRDKIYSYNTYSTYEKHNNYFIAYVESRYPKEERATIAQCKPYVKEWLQSRIDAGLSAYTIQTEAAALGKLYQCSVSDFGVELPERRRADITRSRKDVARDYGFSVTHNAEFIEFCKGTGLRRSEITALTKEQLIEREDGYYLGIYGKGGRYREAPIIGDHVQAIVERIKASDGRVWDKIPSHADIHAYRSNYATAIYKSYERSRDDIPLKERYYCKRDRKGEMFDKAAMLKASEALGHGRLDVVAGHYIR